jgi:hypothetical protein
MLPGSFLDAGDLAERCHFSEADSADTKHPHKAVFSAATETAIRFPCGEFRFLFASGDGGCFGHD